jgi:hypothetical protein
MRFSRAGNIPTIFLPFRFVCTFPLFCLWFVGYSCLFNSISELS